MIRRCAAVKHKGRGNHSSVTDWNQLWKSFLIGCFQNLDGVYAVRRGFPIRVTCSRAGIPKGLALFVELLPRALAH